VGTTVPTALLSAGGTLGNSKIAVWDDGTGARMGLEVQGSQFRLHVNNSGDRFSFMSSEAGTEVMSVTGSGRLGLGLSNPGAKLSLSGDLANTKLAVYDDGAGGLYGFGIQASQFRLHLAAPAGRFSFLNGAAGTEVATITGAGAVGIGIANPTGLLQLHSSTSDSRMYFTTSTSGTTPHSDGLTVGIDSLGAFVYNYEPSPLRLATNGAERLRIEGDGRMGFNATNGDANIGYYMKSPNAGYILWLTDRNGATNFVFQEGGAAFKPGGGSFIALSDARLKSNVTPLAGALDKLLELRSVTFDYKDEKYGKGRQTGFIAQEMQKVFPQWVATNPEGYLGVGFSGFESVAVQALRELRAEKDAALAERDRTIAALDQRVRDLETETHTRLAAIERRLNSAATAAVTANSPR